MNRKFTPILSFSPLVAIAASVFLATNTFAMTITEGVSSARGDDQPSSLFGTTGVFSTISNVLLFVIGAIAVIMIVIGGLRYVISGGDSSQVQAAKNTILYALIGVIIAILAYAIVNFVVGSFVTDGGAGGLNSSSSGVNGTSNR